MSSQEIDFQNKISRREFLRMLGVGGAAVVMETSFPNILRKTKEVLDALWVGRINPTYLEIEGYAGGQIQVRNWEPQKNDWEVEYDSAFAWIHRHPEDPFGFRGLFFIHRDNLLLVEKQLGQIPEGTKVKIYANWNHEPGAEILKARIGVRSIYSANRFDTPTDSLVSQITCSERTIAIVTCHPPDYQGLNPPQRLVYYAWAYLPKSGLTFS